MIQRLLSQLVIRFGYWLYRAVWLMLVIVILLYFFLGTSTGLRLMVNQLHWILRGQLQIQQVEGSLLRGISLQNLNYRDSSVQIQIAHAHVALAYPWIQHNQLIIAKLSAENVLVNLPASNTPSSSSTPWPDQIAFLRYITISRLEIKQATFIRSQQPPLLFNQVLLSFNHRYQVSLDTRFGRMMGYIEYHWTPYFSWRTHFIGEQVNLAPWLNWPTNLRFNIIAQGQVQGKHQTIDLNLMQFMGQFNHYPMKASTHLLVNDQTILIQALQFELAKLIKITGNLEDHWDFHWSVAIPSLNEFFSGAKGRLQSQGIVTGPRHRPLIQANLNAEALQFNLLKIQRITGQLRSTLPLSATEVSIASVMALKLEQLQANQYRIPVIHLTVHPHLVGQALSADFNLSNVAGNQIRGEVELPMLLSDQKLNQPIRGRLTLVLSRLDTLMMPIPYTRDLQGTLTGNALLQGTLNHPDIQASIQLQQGRLSIPSLRTDIQQLTLSAIMPAHRPIQLTGHVRIGQGDANLTGLFDPYQADFPATLNVTGRNLQIANLSDYQITVSPQLKMTYAKQLINVAGEINIPRARITPTHFSTTVTLPKDVVFAGQPVKKSFVPTRLALKINIVLGDQIYIAYDNLTTLLRGHLMITELPYSLPTATGELYTVNGRYQAYGKSLQIQRGRLIYTGNSLSNPGLDIRAVQPIRSIGFSQSQLTNNQFQANDSSSGSQSVGVHVQGTLNKPSVTLFSDPSGLSQGDILSYLVFGYPQSQASGTNALALLQMLPGLSGGGAGLTNTTQQIQSKLGLSELSIGSTEVYNPSSSTESSTTTVSIVKNLGNRLSLQYSIGLFFPVSLLTVRYQLNAHWAIQSETSTIETGGDILYALEKR